MRHKINYLDRNVPNNFTMQHRYSKPQRSKKSAALMNIPKNDACGRVA